MTTIAHQPTAEWAHRVQVKQFMTAHEDSGSIALSMNQIADALEGHPLFEDFFGLTLLRDRLTLAEANDLLDDFYDYCDAHDIWVE